MVLMNCRLGAVVCFSLCVINQVIAVPKYYGKYLGEFITNAHDVRGKVFAADDRSFFIKGFEYDGQGPDAFFWGDTREEPTVMGFIIPHEKGSKNVLKKYNGQDILMTLPDGRSIRNIKSLSVWCKKFSVNFGYIVINDVDLPKEKRLGPLPTFAHGVRSKDVIIKDAKTLFISELYYDGAGPDAFFLAGNGSRPHSKAVKVPDENNSLEKLHGYQGRDVSLRLPGDLTVFEIEWFGLYCIAYEQNFGHVMIPMHANVPANMDDLKMAVAQSIVPRHAALTYQTLNSGKYYGKLIGDIKTNAHEVKGTVYAASDNTFYITDFSYDGQGPDAYFWAGTSEKPSPEGFIVPDEFGTMQVLRKYDEQNISITLPDGKKITDVKWLSVWCRKFAVNFGFIMISSNLELPKEEDLGTLPMMGHGTRAQSVIIKDAKTISIKGLYYDGAAPDAFFYVGNGKAPHSVGTKVPDENGSLEKLKGYQGQDVTIRLPEKLTVFDIDWFALYCISYKENFGHVTIPKNLNVPADIPSLKAEELKFKNCEELFPGVLHVSWKVVGQDLYIQLSGITGENEYLSFGRSGSDDRAAMVGADVVLAFYDKDERIARVVDYYLSAKSQCSQGSGACPDTRLRGTENTELISWNRDDKYLTITYKRPITAGDGQDLSIPMSIPVSVVAAIGSLNSQKEAAFHSQYYNKDPIKIHFGRNPPENNCKPLKPSSPAVVKGWHPRRITHETTFHAQIGPTGKDKGYTAITGIQSWGVAWWINGLLIPELVVQRGVNYTFIVEGGDDPSNSAMFHPFYITNNAEGGGGQFLDQLGNEAHRIYAGVTTDGQKLIPIGIGRYCEWKHKTVDKSAETETFEDFKKTLNLQCNEGSPGTFVWMPDEDTPDLVYYQCFTHRNLGWKIHVRGEKNLGSMMESLSGKSFSIRSSWNILIYLMIGFIIASLF